MRVNVRFSEVNTKIDVDFAENHSRINADFGAVTEIKDPEAENVASVLSELHTENLTDLVTDLHECRRAITYRGGEISATSNFKEVAEKIVTLPASSSIGTVIDEDVSLRKLVPSNSTKYCYLKSIGGMTYKCNNLMPYPYYGGKDVGYTETLNGIKFTVNADRSVTINGTGGGCSFLLANYLDLPNANYTLSAILVSGEWSGDTNTAPYISGFPGRYATGSNRVVTNKTTVTWLSINVPKDVTVNNVTIKPMLNIGTTALPYEDYFEGLQDTKPTAIRSYAANGDLIKEIPIPEALQGTGKGVEGASDTIDFENGKKIIKIGEILLKNMSWTYASNYGFYSYGIKNKFISNKILCDSYTTNTWNNVYSGSTDRCIAGNGQAIIISDSRYTDDASFKASLTDEKLIYALATPTETDIDTSSFDNLIEVEGGGALEFVTDSGEAPNSAVIYQTII